MSFQTKQSSLTTYKHIQLKNQIQCFLCYNLTATESIASISVGAGRMNDPIDHPGLAHFIEHTLFLGSTKYPDEEDFDNYIDRNNGSQNAVTSDATTTYYFSINTKALEGGLERCSQYFISPLFDANIMNKELSIIQEEYKEGMNSNEKRINYLMFTHCNPASSYHRFMGNNDTLFYPQIRDDVISFFKTYYCSSNIKIAIYSSLEFDVISQYLETSFGCIKENKMSLVSHLASLPFEPPYCGRILTIVPKKNNRSMRVNWYMPSYSNDTTKSYHYLLELIGHEGPNSLLSYLKKNGLAHSLVSSIDHIGGAQSIIYIQIELSEEGINTYIDVIDAIYMFINKVKMQGFQQYFADEIIKIGKIKSQFKSNNTTEEKIVYYSNLLHTQSPDDLVNNWYPTKPLIKQLIVESLTNCCPQNMDIFIIGKKFESDSNKVEKYIDVKYSTNVIPDYLINKWNQILPTSEKLGHPPQNTYIPNELPTIPYIADDPVPHLVIKNNCAVCYSRPECNFETPFAKIAINIKTNDNLFSSSALKISFLYVWQAFMQEYLAEDIYLAKLAGNSFKFGYNKKTPTKFLSELCLIINSYTNTVSNLLIDFITKIKECPYRNLEGLFFNCYNKVNYELKSIQYRPPIMQSFLILKSLIYHNEFSIDDILQALSKLTFNIFTSVCDEWLKKCLFNWFIIGNLNDTMVANLVNKVTTIVGYEPLPFWSFRPSRVAKLSPSKMYSFAKVTPINNEISSLLHYVQCDSKYSCAFIYLAIQIMKPEYFNQLRTKKKLGYTVDCESIQLIDTYALAFLITSDEHRPEQLIQYNIEFFDFIIEKINGITDKEFSHMVNIAIQHFSQNDFNLKQQFLKYYHMASIYDFTFGKYTELVKALQLMKLSEFQQFSKDFLGANCRQLCIQLMNNSYIKENKEREMNTILHVKAHSWAREEIPYIRLLSAVSECYNDSKLMRLYNNI